MGLLYHAEPWSALLFLQSCFMVIIDGLYRAAIFCQPYLTLLSVNIEVLLSMECCIGGQCQDAAAVLVIPSRKVKWIRGRGCLTVRSYNKPPFKQCLQGFMNPLPSIHPSSPEHTCFKISFRDKKWERISCLFCPRLFIWVHLPHSDSWCPFSWELPLVVCVSFHGLVACPGCAPGSNLVTAGMKKHIWVFEASVTWTQLLWSLGPEQWKCEGPVENVGFIIIIFLLIDYVFSSGYSLCSHLSVLTNVTEHKYMLTVMNA